MVVIAGVEEPPKDELLARLRDERAAWDALVAQAGDLLTEPGLEGDWSLKDVIAHLCAYERFLVTELGGNVRALPPMPPDVAMDIERRNVWMHLHDTDQAATDVLREATDVHAQLLDQIARRSQEALEQPLVKWNDWPIWRWVINLTYEHRTQHIAPLRRLLGLAQ